jgi:hypothetical protein
MRIVTAPQNTVGVPVYINTSAAAVAASLLLLLLTATLIDVCLQAC